MRAWPSPQLPRLPGWSPRLRLHDTSTGALVATGSEPVARMYVCGITPYDATHLGHAATYVAFDLVNRVWRDSGLEVRYTQNVTDVDDPLLERAERDGLDWEVLAAEQIELFRGDMQALRLIPPDDYVGAVESIPLVVDLIELLRARGAVYGVDQDLYFSVRADPAFGSVAGLDESSLVETFAERGGDPKRPGKHDPLDCLLWMARRPGEPGWASALGEGRPGWHVECTAIALTNLGVSFDVQGGGRDLAFPHHEMCAAQAHVATDTRPFARAYVHAGLVGLDGEKMSKSRGNLVFVSVLRHEGRSPAAIRLALLAHHYRADWEWTPQDLEQAEARLVRWRAAVSASSGPAAQEVLAAVRGALANDLDAPGALSAVDDWVARASGEIVAGNAADGAAGPEVPGAPALVRDMVDALLGVDLG